MGLEDITSVQISTSGSGPTRQGFGTPLILSTKTAAFAGGRLLTFSKAATLLSSGFVATDPEYLAAAAMFAQNPSPQKIMVGLLNNKPTPQFTLSPVAQDSTPFKVVFNGLTVAQFTSGVGATSALISAGIVAAITALALPNATAVVVGGTVVITGLLGGFIDLESVNTQGFGVMPMVETNTDPGVAADLGAFLALDSFNWYMVISPWASTAMNTAIAAWTEANSRTFLVHTVDGGGPTASGSDIATAFMGSSYARSLGIWHPRSGAMIDAAWAGRTLPYDPGSETWKFKTLAGVPLPIGGVTDTMMSFLRGKKWNFYQTVAQTNFTEDGLTSAGEFIDVVRGRDWLKNSIQTAVFSRLMASPKIPYTDVGAAILAGVVKNQLVAAVRVGFLSGTPEPTVTWLPVAQQLQADRANRYMPNINFSGVIAGAVHKLAIIGVLSV